jgi:hypothetical protein
VPLPRRASRWLQRQFNLCPASWITAVTVRSPKGLRRRADRLSGQRQEHLRQLRCTVRQREKLDRYLELAVPVTDAIRLPGDQLFEQVLGTLQSRLTIAVADVLEQNNEFRATADFKRRRAIVDFLVQRDGFSEDILPGQGRSVQNVFSVGLRIFALATLNPDQHRPFLVLDERDCWLRPDLAPRLGHFISGAARDLGFVVLMISHHDMRVFEKCADRILRFVPDSHRVSLYEHGRQSEAVDI